LQDKGVVNMSEVNRKGPGQHGQRYLERAPRKIPPGRIIVHNHVMHTKDMSLGLNGFRAWTLPEIELTGGSGEWNLVVCKCGWMGLPHYRVKGLGSGKCVTRSPDD
jgi:hypothetical protein